MIREKAIKILSCRDNNGIPISWQNGFVEAVDTAIKALQEQKTGEWICEPHPNWGKWGIHIARCSECGFSGGTGKWNFCPNCGARMEESEE